MSIRPLAVSLAATLLLLSNAFAGSSSRRPGCTAPKEITRFKVKLRNTAGAIRLHKPVVIVAIGSSSTEGVGASDPTHPYPALLADELHERPQSPEAGAFFHGVGADENDHGADDRRRACHP